MRYRLRTLLMALAILPPLLWIGWGKYQAWGAEQERLRALTAARLRLKQQPDYRAQILAAWAALDEKPKAELSTAILKQLQRPGSGTEPAESPVAVPDEPQK